MRGHNVIFMAPYGDPPNGNESCRARSAITELEGTRRSMGQTKTFVTRMNLARVHPARDVASTGYCLANPAASTWG
jgi:hypothetical protein